jgi:NRPS condensation-like uncharacterized protein
MKPFELARFPRLSQRFPAATQDLLNYLIREVGDQQIHYVFHFSGQLDERRMARAMRLLMELEPTLGCRFVTTGGFPFWQRRKDLDALTLCRVVKTNQPEAYMLAFAAEPTNPKVDPLVSACIFRAATDTLHVRVNHVVTDATGARDICYLLAALYRRLEQQPEFFPKPNKGSRSQQQLLKHLGAEALVKALVSARPSAITWGCPYVEGDIEAERRFVLKHFAPERFAAIRDYGKARGATVNDVLLAAFYRAMAASSKPHAGQAFNVMVPVNLRRFIPEGRTAAICNMTGAVFPSLEYEPGESFEGTLLRTRNAMNHFKAEYPGVGTIALFSMSAKTGFPLIEKAARKIRENTVKTGKSVGVLSNFGITEAARLNFGELEVVDSYALGPIVYPPGMFIAVSSFKERLTLSSGFCESATLRAFIEAFLAHMDSELPNPVAQPDPSLRHQITMR